MHQDGLSSARQPGTRAGRSGRCNALPLGGVGLRARPPRTPAVSACTRDCREGSRTLISCRRSRSGGALTEPSYIALLVLGALVGVPVAVVAYFFLKARRRGPAVLFTTLPAELGFDAQPDLVADPVLAFGGLLVALTIQLPARHGGPQAGRGLQDGGAVRPDRAAGHHPRLVRHAQPRRRARPGGAADRDRQRPRRARRAPDQADAPPMAVAVIGAAGSFAAISTLLGSPLVGAFLLMEAAGLGGAMLGVVLRARAARRRHRRADLRRPRQLDRLRHLLARGPGHPAVRHARPSPSSSGRSRSACSARARRHRDQAARARRSSRSSSAAWCC